MKNKVKDDNIFNTLKFKIWASFSVFTLLIILILVLLQTVFFKTYYEFEKKNEIISIANNIKRNISSKKLQDLIDNKAYKYSANIYVIKDDEIIFSSNTSDLRSEGPVVYNYEQFKENIIFRVTNERFNTELFGYIVSTNSIKILVTTSVVPIGTTVNILSNQLIYVSIILVILGFIISFAIAKTLTRPIKEMEIKANQLAKGNYDIEFSTGNYEEIDSLANTLNYATKELKQTDELRRELMANISHDLKTPLTMIKSYSEMLIDLPYKKEERNKKLEIIIEETDRLNILVNDIIDLSKLESNIENLDLEVINISELINTIIKRFDYLIEKENYIIETNVDQNLYVKVDQKKISQVIYNLISNAINYTGKDKKININLLKQDNIIKFTVSDTGKGIKKEDLNKIWDKYYKIKLTHKRNTVSTGLGLSIVKNILLEHNLNFGVNTTINKGSTFYIDFIECKEAK